MKRSFHGAEPVRIFHEDIPVRARIHAIGGFSAHADHDEPPSGHRRIDGHKRTVLVHGEEDVMRRFAQHLHDTVVLMPGLDTELPL